MSVCPPFIHRKTFLCLVLLAEVVFCAFSFSWLVPPVTVTTMKMAMDIDPDLMPKDPMQVFPDGVKKVLCWFQWKDAKVNTSITVRWTYATDNIHILDYNFEIPRKEGFGGIALVMPEDKKLPLGEYRVDLLFEGKVLQSSIFDVRPDMPDYFVLAGSNSMTAGTTNALTITGYDRFGYVATGYAGTHPMTFTGPGKSPNGSIPQVAGADIGGPSDINFTAGVSDQGAMLLSAYKAQTTTLNVSDGKHNSQGHGLDLTVTPAAADHLDFDQPASDAIAGTKIFPPVTATIKDAYGNPLPHDNATQVTISLGSNPGNGTLSGTLKQTMFNGTAEFSDLSINKAAGGYRLTVSSGALNTATSAPFTINPGPAQYLMVTGAGTMEAGKTNDLTVTAVDAFDNVATGYRGARTLTFSGPVVSFDAEVPQIGEIDVGKPVAVNFMDGASAAGKLPLVAYKSETTVVNVSDGKLNSNGHGLHVTVMPAAINHLTFIQGPSDAKIKTTLSPALTVVVLDAYDNLRVQDNITQITVKLAKGNPKKKILQGTTIQQANTGIATFDDLSLLRPGQYTLEAESYGILPAASDPFTITKK